MKKKSILKKLKYEYGLCPKGVKIYEACLDDLDKVAYILKRWVELFIEHPNAIELFELMDSEELDYLTGKGVYYNRNIDDAPVYNKEILLLGNSKVNVELSGFDFMRIYALNDSILNVNASGNAICFVDAYNRSEINANEQVKINSYDNAKVNGGKVKKKEYKVGEIFNYDWDIKDFKSNPHKR